MKIKNIFKNSLFFSSFRLAKSNPGKLAMMILFDSLFLISFFIFQKSFGYFTRMLTLPQIQNSFYSVFVLIVYSLIYYMLILLVYSFFKYCLLDFIKSLFTPSKFSFKKLGNFFLLNLAIAGIFFAISAIAGAILINIKEAFQPYLFILLASPYWVVYNKYSILSLHSLIFYIVVNISHSLFYEGASLADTIKNGFSTAFTKIASYRKIISSMILAALAFGILFLGMNYSLKYLAAKNFYLYVYVNSYFQQASVIIFDVAFYFIILINRISFYKAAKVCK